MQADELSSLLETELSGLAWSMQPGDLEQFGQDWTRFHQPDAAVVFFPNNTEEVQRIIQLANRTGQVVIPSGGRTGYSAGAVATAGEWVISMVRFNQISDFNPIDQTVRVGAGVITEQLQQFAEEQGLFYPVDFASSGSSHIAGNIAHQCRWHPGLALWADPGLCAGPDRGDWYRRRVATQPGPGEKRQWPGFQTPVHWLRGHPWGGH